MTTATRPSRLRYEVRCGSWLIGEADDREGAEELRDRHAMRNGDDPLSDRYTITPVLRKVRNEHGLEG